MGGLPDEGAATTREDLIRTIDVTITDGGIEIERDIDRPTLVRGSIGKFRVTNRSSKRRNFVVGVDRSPLLAPGERASFLVDIAIRGPLPYRVTVNCAPGLNGEFRVF